MKKLFTSAIVLLLIIPMFSVLLPKVQAIQTDSEDPLSSSYSAFQDLVSSALSESDSNPIPVGVRTQRTNNRQKDANSGAVSSGLGWFDSSTYGSNKDLLTSPKSLSEEIEYSTTSSGGIYIDYAKTGDDPYDQYDFGTTVELKIDVDNSDPGTRDVDVFVYMWTPGHHGVDMDKTYNWAVQGTVDDPKWFYLDVGFEHLEYVGLKWPIDITVRDSSTYIVLAQKKVFVTIGPILSNHFTCKDYNNPYGTKTTTFYDTDEKAVEYTLWDTHNLWITWSVKFKFYGPMGEYWTSDWVDLQPGYYEYWVAAWIWIKDHVPAYNPGSWYVDVLLEDHFRARDNFEIVATVLPSLDVNLVSPADGSTVETSPIELKARVTSDGSAVQNALVRFYVKGGEVDSDYSDSSGYASINYYPPAPDTYNWYAKAEKSGYIEDTSSTWSFTYSPPAVLYTISLSSRTTDGPTNVGSITFDAQTYSLPTTVSKSSGTYQVTANPPAEYGFDLWEYSGSISVSDPASQTTSVTVSGDCALKAVFSMILIPDFEISVDPSSATVDQGGSLTATVMVTSINGYSYSVSLSASGQPNGVTISFDPTSETPTFTSTMTVQVAYDVPADTYQIGIKGKGSDPESKIGEKTFSLTVNKITFLNDPRLEVGQSSYDAEIFGVTLSFNIYGIEPYASNEDYKSAVYQHFGISLSGDVQHESMAMFEIYGFYDLAEYFNQQWWASWIFTSDFLSYIYNQHDTDGAARVALVFRHSIVTDWEYWVMHLSLAAWDLVKLLNGAYQYTDVTLKNLLEEIADLFAGIPIEFGLYQVFLESPHNTKTIINIGTSVIAQWAQKLSDFLNHADLYVIILKIGLRVMGILWNIKDPVSLANFIVSIAFEIADYLITQYFHDYVPEPIASIVHIIASWDDPPDLTADIQVFSEDGDLVLGWDSTSNDFVDYSSTGFVIRDSNTQIVFIKKTASVTVGIVAHGGSSGDIPYTLSIIDDYGNESYVSSGFLTTDQSVNIDLSFIENITQFGNRLIVDTDVSTTTPIQGQLLTINIAVNDTAGPRSDVAVTLLINSVTWVIADSLGSGQYQSVIDTWSLLGLVPIAIYADYPDMTTGYDAILLNVSDAPPDINVLSPQDTTYTTDTFDLTFTISEPTSWIGYSLDDQANITIAGNITLTGLTEGLHHIIVYANDTSGNMGFSNIVYFTIDTIPPTTSMSLSGTLGLDDWYMSDVTVTLAATDAVSGVAVTAYSFDGATWFTYSGPFTITDEGLTTIYYNSTDNAGNIEDTKSATVKIDKTNPLTTIDLMGTLGNDDWYVSDVTVTLGASDAVSGILKIEYSFDEDTWIIYTIPFTIDTEGTTTVYVKSTDNAGNVETGTFDVKIDKTPPDLVKFLSGTLGNNDWYASDVIVTLSGSDAVSDLASVQYSFDDTTWYTYSTPFSIGSDGITTLYHKASDIAGNEFVLPPQQIKIDKTPPMTTDSLIGTFSNGWYTSDVTITLDAFDATSGVENIFYKVDNGVEQIYLAPFLVSGDGPHTIEFWSTDNAGNVETYNTDTFQIDMTAPVTTASLSGTLGLNDWYVTSVQVTLTGEDPGESFIPPTGSGICRTYYILNGGLQTEYTGPFMVSEQGSHTVQFWSFDIAENNEVLKIKEFKIDTVAPVTTPSQSPDGNNDWWKTSPATVTLTASDATSGVMEMHYKVDSGSYVAVFGASALVIVGGNGIHTVNYYAVDHAGNQETEKTETIKIDTSSPTTTLYIGSPQFTSHLDLYVTSATSFTLSPLDNPEGSDIANTYYRVYRVDAMPPPFDSGTAFQISGDDGEYTIEYYSTDNAGNEETPKTKSVILDNTPPVTTKTVGSPSFDNFVTSATQFSLDASDGGAGVDGTYYRINGGPWTLYLSSFTLSGSDGVYTIEFYSIDNLGNTEIVHSQTHTLDNTAPSSSDSLSGTIGDNDWFISSVTVTLASDDGSGSGLATIYYKLDNGVTMSYSDPFLVTEDGWHTIEFWSVDDLGNLESPPKTDSFEIDTTPPSTSASLSPETPNGQNNWYTVPVEVTLTASDETSGVEATFYCINDGPVRILVIDIPVIISDDGVYTICFWSVDNAGNVEAINSVSFKIDQTPPTTTLTIGEPKYVQNPTYVSPTTDFTLEAMDVTSGVSLIEYKIDDGAWTLYTAPFNVAEFGPHMVYYHSIDNAGNVEETQQASIIVAATSTEYLGETTGQCSDPIVLEARLIDMATQQPIPSKTIIFTIGSQSETAETDSGGIATTSIVLDQPAGPYTVSVTFEGDEEYLASSDSEAFKVEKEMAEVEYTGDTIVPTTAKTINLRATVFDSPDGYWGDLTKIEVTFSIYAGLLGSTPFMTIPAVPVSQTDMPGVGVAVATIDILPENGYLIIVSIDSNDYYKGPTSDATPLTVYEPTGDFVTGGGWIWDPSGSKGNFGFNVKYTKSGKPQGHATYVYREDGWDVIVKSNAWIGLAIDGNHAFFEAKCVVQKYNPTTGELVWAEGNYKFRVDVWDNDSEEGVDIYQIRVLDKNGVVYHEAGFDPLGELQGGNIVIHDERKKKP